MAGLHRDESEAEFERQLIESLTTGTVTPQVTASGFDLNSGIRTKNWTYRPDIKTIGQLEQNFKSILEQNNRSQLDRPLSEYEFRQVMNQISALSSPYEAGKFLYGIDGVSEISVQLENGKTVILQVFDQSQVGAGNTVYEVVNQIQIPASDPMNKDRRFDVTLLINGLPMYQIELKRDGIDVDEALIQLKQYVDEGCFSGIFSTTQILMGMTPSNMKYMARPAPGRFSKDFAFNWKDAKNLNVRRWKNIADTVLTIPAAHLLATNYMILDSTKTKESIKVMRPYQVAATRQALNAINQTDFSNGLNKDGFIWHTTGSGKTITSFKTASIAAKSPNVDKVIFLVDRKSLTKQTLEKYNAYHPDNQTDDSDELTAHVKGAKSTSDLGNKLKAEGTDIIITSTQKLRRLIKRAKYQPADRKYLFVVDEAHRSTGTDSFDDIQKYFSRSAWIGYSGTPRFDETEKGSRTVDVFGPLLHAYTIKEAIADRNVLGFKVEFNDTVKDEDKLEKLKAYYKELNPGWSDKRIEEQIQSTHEDDVDSAAVNTVYDNNPAHVKAVVSDILTNWEARSVGGKYNALLTTHVGGGKASIPMAFMYYDEFKKRNKDRIAAGLRPLKVAISIGRDDTNGEYMNLTNDGLKAAMADYNEMFGTSFSMNDVDLYNSNVEDRLAKTTNDDNYLDLVIVVDRLLTGFDAPQLNTLYVDRILKGSGLIQAYSRTNRIEDMMTKPFGNVVNYRWPKRSEELMNEALAVYSNRDNGNLTPEQRKVIIEEGFITALSYPEQIEKTKGILQKIQELTHDFQNIPSNDKKQDELAHLFREYNGQIAKLKQYALKYDEDGEPTEGFDYRNPDRLLSDLGLSDVEQKTITVTLTNELKRLLAARNKVPVSMIDLRVEKLKEVLVDYDYLTALLEDLMNQVHENKMDEAQQTRSRIMEFSDSLEDRAYARTVMDATEAIWQREFPTSKSGLSYPYQLFKLRQQSANVPVQVFIAGILDQARNSLIDRQLLDFRNKWGITDVISGKDLKQLIDSHDYDKKDLDVSGVLIALLNAGGKAYRTMSNDEEVQKLSPIKYRNALRDAVYELADGYVKEV